MKMKAVLGLIMGGGQGSRLYPLTKLRAKPAVPLAGKYRLIDIPISNCLHAGIDKIAILTQYNSVSLHRHIQRAYARDKFTDGWVQILAAEQTPQSTGWYQGTADAVRQQMMEIEAARTEYVLILAGDHLYNMDYRAFVDYHVETGADITMAVQPVQYLVVPRLFAGVVMVPVLALVFFLVAGIEALLIRVQLFQPNGTVLTAGQYNQLFTMHGTTMVFLVGMPVLVGFANYFVPLMIGARDVAFPRLNALGYWMLPMGGFLLHYSFLAGRGPDAGWFSYAPLSTRPYTDAWNTPPRKWTVCCVLLKSRSLWKARLVAVMMPVSWAISSKTPGYSPRWSPPPGKA